ncbi:serpin family protein [Paenibacillus lemnae]|uniref:Serpin family protein n=1 Tax=Paenibacillus lemnae TaxID=1330551 RepID=A0A848M7R4_PAELE|nr:serpin family protein [Paenibacillus lemnae]NMO96122.1 serpin family protein [Paenibacillus lemnae]
MRRKWILAALGMTLLLTSCGHSAGKSQSEAEPLDQQEREAVLAMLDKSIVEAQNAFGLRLYQQLETEQKSGNNVILSPYSISAALALAYNGSAGETKAEMEKVLGWTGMEQDQVNKGNSQLRLLLERGSGVMVNTANSIWIQEGFTLQEDYLNRLKEFYDAQAYSADLASNAFVKDINKWVDQQTGGMIKELYQDPPGLTAALVNTIYFNGRWEHVFNPEFTKKESFTQADGSVQEVPMMTMERRYDYKESEAWQAVKLPYGDGRMYMLVILPSETSSLEELHTLLWKDASLWDTDYSYETVKLGLPRFKAEGSVRLEDTLEAMGLEKATDPRQADFSGITKESGLFISQVLHKTVVDVNEEGTEAAAVTAIGMAGSAPPEKPIEMTVNRPFFFAIVERDTGAWLFMGGIRQL